jgi:hypothetical protein
VDLLVRKYQPSASYSILRADIFEAAGRHREAASACDSAIALLSMHPRSGNAGDEVATQIATLNDRKMRNLNYEVGVTQP